MSDPTPNDLAGCPPNFLDPEFSDTPRGTAAQQLRLKRLDALGLSHDELLDRIQDLESQTSVLREMLSQSLGLLQRSQTNLARYQSAVQTLRHADRGVVE